MALQEIVLSQRGAIKAVYLTTTLATYFYLVLTKGSASWCTARLSLFASGFKGTPSCGPIPWILVASAVIVLFYLAHSLSSKGLPHAHLKILMLEVSGVAAASQLVETPQLDRFLTTYDSVGRLDLVLIAVLSQAYCYCVTTHMLRHSHGRVS